MAPWNLQATRSETMNQRRIRNIFIALAVLGAGAAIAAPAYGVVKRGKLTPL